jgi:hypothetical protein
MGMHLWLVAHEPNIYTMWAGSHLPDLFGLAERAGAHGSLCLIDAAQPGLALLAWSDESAGVGELCVLSPPGNDTVAERLRSLVSEWESRGRPVDADAEIRACPRRPRDSAPGGRGEVAIELRWTRFALSWRGSGTNRRRV